MIHSLSRRMKRGGSKSGRQQTEFINLDSGKCRACWKCIDSCPEKVFGKINIIIHKHALIINDERCTGCGKCVKTCDHKAINRLKKREDYCE